MKIETKRLIITKFTMDMAEAVHLNSLDEDNRRFVPDEVFETVEEKDYSIKEESIIEIQKLDIPLLAPDEDEELLFKTMTALHLPQDI